MKTENNANSRKHIRTIIIYKKWHSPGADKLPREFYNETQTISELEYYVMTNSMFCDDKMHEQSHVLYVVLHAAEGPHYFNIRTYTVP